MKKAIYNVDGRLYNVAQNGNVLTARERGVRLGSVRAFNIEQNFLHPKRTLYYAEREFESIIPFRAPVIWWRKVDEDTQK